MAGRSPATERDNPYPDFAFSQQLSPELAPPNWRPHYVDYFILGITTSTAFSPTDVMPMKAWSKLAHGGAVAHLADRARPRRGSRGQRIHLSDGRDEGPLQPDRGLRDDPALDRGCRHRVDDLPVDAVARRAGGAHQQVHRRAHRVFDGVHSGRTAHAGRHRDVHAMGERHRRGGHRSSPTSIAAASATSSRPRSTPGSRPTRSRTPMRRRHPSRWRSTSSPTRRRPSSSTRRRRDKPPKRRTRSGGRTTTCSPSCSSPHRSSSPASRPSCARCATARCSSCLGAVIFVSTTIWLATLPSPVRRLNAAAGYVRSRWSPSSQPATRCPPT